MKRLQIQSKPLPPGNVTVNSVHLEIFSRTVIPLLEPHNDTERCTMLLSLMLTVCDPDEAKRCIDLMHGKLEEESEATASGY